MTANRKKVIRDIFVRAGKTFTQAFISYLSIDSLLGISDVKALERVLISILVGALAAGLSAVWNGFIEWLTLRIDELDFDDVDLENKNTVEVVADDN